MTIDKDNLLESIMASISRIDYIKPEEIPNIDLYMDQVTTFMETHLKSSKRHEEDKILTKTMINNYAKNNLLPPPVKKKYSKEHLLMLTFIYYFKNILSINDIQRLLDPLAKHFFDTKEEYDLTALYQEVMEMEIAQIHPLKDDITRKLHQAEDSFADVPEDQKEFMHTFAFICLLSFDVYVKKLLIEKLVDQLPEEKPSKK